LIIIIQESKITAVKTKKMSDLKGDKDVQYVRMQRNDEEEHQEVEEGQRQEEEITIRFLIVE
jgi:hypothetical protein